MCFSVAVHVAQELRQKVTYIDTNGGLYAKRLLQILQQKTGNTAEQVGHPHHSELIPSAPQGSSFPLVRKR